MYFCYVDESGDYGVYDRNKPGRTGTDFFILVGIVVPANKWKLSLEALKAFRKKISREGFLPYDIEFHCSEMVDPHKIKAYTSISVADRWRLIEEFAEAIGGNAAFNLIAVVIDKLKTALRPEEYLTTSITRLYQSFDEHLKLNTSNGVLFFDRANERNINTHVRNLLGTGASGEAVPDVRISWVIEDPIFRISSDSMFIQSADVVAYTLKEREFPQSSRRKYQAHKIFERKLRKICLTTKIADSDGIIRV